MPVLIVGVSVLTIISWRPLFASFFSNWAQIELRRAIAVSTASDIRSFFWGTGIRSVWPTWGKILSRQPQPPCGETRATVSQHIIHQLERVQQLWPHHTLSARLLARAYSLAGDPAKAVTLLLSQTNQYPDNLLLDLYLGDTYDTLGDSKAAIERYSSVSSANRQEKLIANYLLLAERARTRNDARVWLAKASEVDPSNLYVLYLRLLLSDAIDDKENYRAQLRYFDAGALKPPCDMRLQSRMQSLIPQLVIEGFWSIDTALQVVKEWIHAGRVHEAGAITERLWHLEDANPRLALIRGQIYQQMEDTETAKEIYQRAIELAPSYGPVYYSLGMLLHETGHPERAIDCLATSYILSGDLVSLEKLVDICDAVSLHKCAESWRGELKRRTDDVAIISDLLNVDERAVKLGSNLIEDDSQEGSLAWHWTPMFSSKVWNEALFLGRVEEPEQGAGDSALHVIGLWIARNPELEPARAGFAAPKIPLRTGARYVLSFLYKTEGLREGHATIYLSRHPEALFAGDYLLPETHGAWWKFLAIGTNLSSDVVEIVPRLRSFGTGDAWFKDASLREILTPADVEVSQTVFEISGQK